MNYVCNVCGHAWCICDIWREYEYDDEEQNEDDEDDNYEKEYDDKEDD